MLVNSENTGQSYDLVVAGSGFGSLFFLEGYLKRFPKARCLLLEWGSYRDADWQVANQKNGDIDPQQTFTSRSDEKPWNFSIGFGGGTNCWWAQTPRLAPNDFRLKTKYGVGEDWPISYDEIEPYYVEAEQIMQVAGADDTTSFYPRSASYPQPAHALSTVDRMMKAKMPEHHFAAPTARLSRSIGSRGTCCNTVNCSYCPTQAKFTALNTFQHLTQSPQIDILVNAKVLAVETEGGHATGLRYELGGKENVAKGDLVALGCNAIHTPFILMRSGLDHPVLGRYLHEKQVVSVDVFLDGIDHFDGGVPISGFNTLWVDGDHRKTAAAALVYFVNHFKTNGLRTEWGRWRQTLPLEIFVEDIPGADNRVVDNGSDRPAVEHPSRSTYCQKGIERALEKLPEMLAALPVERIERNRDIPTGSHVQGTCRMGSSPETSIVDGGLIHHGVRNLLVLGTAVWPSCATANPSLTAAALSLRASQLV